MYSVEMDSNFPPQVLVLDTCVTQKQKVHGRELGIYATVRLDNICNFSLFLTGIWVWGTPVEMDIDGTKTSVFYLDTEGFESIGKSNVYDDR